MEFGITPPAAIQRHYSNPFLRDRLITFAWHPGDVPHGIMADIIEPEFSS